MRNAAKPSSTIPQPPTRRGNTRPRKQRPEPCRLCHRVLMLPRGDPEGVCVACRICVEKAVMGNLLIRYGDAGGTLELELQPADQARKQALDAVLFAA